MDGFDDLLDKTRSDVPILDNPFEDPFARPRSPDPWSTFSQTPVAEHAHEPQSPVQPAASSTAETPQSPTVDAVDPLDAKAANEEDEAEDLHPPRRAVSDVVSSARPSPVTSPISVTPAEPAESPAPDPSPQPKSPSPPAASPPPPTTEPAPPPPQPSPPPTPPPATAAPASPTSPPPAPRPSIVSPLENGAPPPPASFATLALGGEMPGWQGSQSTFVDQARADEDAGGWGEHGHGNGAGFVNGAQSDDDPDDDVPIAQQQQQKQALAPVPAAATGSAIQPMFVITVGDPQKVGDPVRPYITYTVHTRTTSPLYRRSSFSVLRRYNDFAWIYETLSLNNPGVIVPPVPEKQQYGRFQDPFVEQRRAALNRCIQKIADHPALRDDPDLKLFLESDSFVMDIKHRKAEIAHERGGLMASIGSSLVGPRFYETDEWFDHKRAYLDSLEAQLRGLVKAIDMVSKQRNEVALSMAEFAENIAALGACDVSAQLAHTLGALAEVQRRARALQEMQAREDVATVMSTVDEYARLVSSVRLAFTSRVRLYASWQNADADVRKVQQTHEKARRQGRIPADRLSGSLAEIAEAERRAVEAKQEFDTASKMIKSELARFEHERVEDFKNALVAFLDGMVAKQKEIIQSWEEYQETLLKRMTPPTTQSAPTSLAS